MGQVQSEWGWRWKGARCRVDSCIDVKQRCDRLSEQLCCGKYYLTAKDKTADLKKWEGGESRVLVATGALGAGVDVSKVVDVIHVGKPWTYKDFSQESGRGGRGNETVRSVCFIESWELVRGEEEKTLDENDVA